ncbi:hypothetical protein [Devosia sp.]|uniref:hypothetical protein n=1 Tax=Devosia sp. TaxID=1871048 RepID=UPI001AD06BB0|nr:hypothetical protein [Devosia sp.]MBN9334260.1 hypothetical protein [Devosia sp.]
MVRAALVTEGAAPVYLITTLRPDGIETHYAIGATSGTIVVTVDVQDEGNDDYGDGRNYQDGCPSGGGDGDPRATPINHS